MKQLPRLPLFKTLTFLAVCFLSFHAFHLTPQVSAQEEDLWFIPTSLEHQIALDECSTGSVGLECTVQSIVVEIMNSMSYSGAGEINPENDETFRRSGALFFAGAGIGGIISSPPVSFHHFTNYLARRLNLAQPAYAQLTGTGYDALSPFMPLWTAFRNIAYLAFVLIFIFIGFMIMFRAKIDPQTVINIQNALPNLVITLILITFSYAIAGFMVDLIYLGIYLIIAVFADQGLIGSAVQARNTIIEENLFTLVFTGLNLDAVRTLSENIQTVVEDVLGGITGDIAGFISDPLSTVILNFAILISVFRLFFQVVLAYVQIILSTIFAPLMILTNAFPGSGSFSSWLKNLLANVLIFPAIAAIFLISAVIIGPCEDCALEDWEIQQELIPEGTTAWLPPFTGFTTDANAVKGLIGFGLILFSPQVATMLKQALKSKPLPASGVFGAVAAGAGAAGAAGRVISAPGRGLTSMAKTYGSSYVGQLAESAAGETKYRQ